MKTRFAIKIVITTETFGELRIRGEDSILIVKN